MTRGAAKRNRTRQLEAAVKDVCAQFGVPEPALALAHFGAGVDPRGYSVLVGAMCELANKYPETLPPLDVWVALAKRLQGVAPFLPVSRDDSLGALKALLPYLHAKRSEIDIESNVEVPLLAVSPEVVKGAVEELLKKV